MILTVLHRYLFWKPSDVWLMILVNFMTSNSLMEGAQNIDFEQHASKCCMSFYY